MLINDKKTWKAPKQRYSWDEIVLLWELLRPAEKPLSNGIIEELVHYHAHLQKVIIESSDVGSRSKDLTLTLEVTYQEGSDVIG